jgi:hypothetical protein
LLCTIILFFCFCSFVIMHLYSCLIKTLHTKSHVMACVSNFKEISMSYIYWHVIWLLICIVPVSLEFPNKEQFEDIKVKVLFNKLNILILCRCSTKLCNWPLMLDNTKWVIRSCKFEKDV